MKIFKNTILLLLVAFTQNMESQAGINIFIQNSEISGNTWSFDLAASASATYTNPNDNDWQAFNIRFDVQVPSGVVVLSGNANMNPAYTSSGSIQLNPPGTPPAGSVDVGITGARTTQLDLTTTVVTLGSYSVTFSGPVPGSNLANPRTSTSGSGSFWSNAISGSRPFNLPAAFPLPIKLSSFSAVKDGDRSARLDWTSSSEVNSAYFGVERSTDGTSWETIGKVNAAGNSSAELAYQYYDRNLPISRSNDQVFYYRLQLVDIDGKYKYSDVRGVNFKGISSTDVISLYPNPTTSMVNIDLREMDINHGTIDLKVMDMAGRYVINKTINGNGIEAVDVSRFDAGTYQVMVTQGSKQHQKRFIKVN